MGKNDTVQFSVKFKRSEETIALALGTPRPVDGLTVGDMQDVPRLEAALEKLTGLRVHIEQV